MDGHVRAVRDAIAQVGDGFAHAPGDRVWITASRRPAQQLQPNAAFKKAGLLEVDAAGRVTTWQAYFHAEGGAGFVFLKDPSDIALRRARSRSCSRHAEGRSAERHRVGVVARAISIGSARIRARASAWGCSRASTPGEVTTPSSSPPRNRGGHGFDPNLPELHASLIVAGTVRARTRQSRHGPHDAGRANRGATAGPDARQPGRCAGGSQGGRAGAKVGVGLTPPASAAATPARPRSVEPGRDRPSSPRARRDRRSGRSSGPAGRRGPTRSP